MFALSESCSWHFYSKNSNRCKIQHLLIIFSFIIVKIRIEEKQPYLKFDLRKIDNMQRKTEQLEPTIISNCREFHYVASTVLGTILPNHDFK